MSDIEYYSRREIQERTRASQANDPAVAAIHHDLAIRYRERATSMIDNDRSDHGLRIVR